MTNWGFENRVRTEFFSDFYTANGMSDLSDERLLMRNRLWLDLYPEEWWSLRIEAMDSREFGSDLIRRTAVAKILFVYFWLGLFQIAVFTRLKRIWMYFGLTRFGISNRRLENAFNQFKVQSD